MIRLLSLFFLLTAFLPVYSQKTLVFFGSFNRDKAKEGIYVYELDTVKGKLYKRSSLSGILNPSFLTLSSDGKHLFACTESKTKNAGSVSSFLVDADNAEISFISSQKSGGENPVYLTLHSSGNWLINGNYTESSVCVFPVEEDGKILPLVQNFYFNEGSINKDRQEKSHIHSTVFSPDFRYVLAPDLGSDKIRLFQFDSDLIEPLQKYEKSFLTTSPGSGPRHFTFHPGGKFAYSVEEMAGAISVYKYQEGDLIQLQRINTHPENLVNNFESSDVHISPDGKFLYASNRGAENNIAIFSINSDGTLKNIGYQSTLGKHPRVFAIDESGKFLIATNSVSGTISVFKRNLETGLLKKVGKKIKIFGVSSVRIKRY